MNRVHQPRTLLVLGLNAGMGTAAGADELVEIRTETHAPDSGPRLWRGGVGAGLCPHTRQAVGAGFTCQSERARESGV